MRKKTVIYLTPGELRICLSDPKTHQKSLNGFLSQELMYTKTDRQKRTGLLLDMTNDSLTPEQLFNLLTFQVQFQSNTENQSKMFINHLIDTVVPADQSLKNKPKKARGNKNNTQPSKTTQRSHNTYNPKKTEFSLLRLIHCLNQLEPKSYEKFSTTLFNINTADGLERIMALAKVKHSGEYSVNTSDSLLGKIVSCQEDAIQTLSTSNDLLKAIFGTEDSYVAGDFLTFFLKTNGSNFLNKAVENHTIFEYIARKHHDPFLHTTLLNHLEKDPLYFELITTPLFETQKTTYLHEMSQSTTTQDPIERMLEKCFEKKQEALLNLTNNVGDTVLTLLAKNPSALKTNNKLLRSIFDKKHTILLDKTSFEMTAYLLNLLIHHPLAEHKIWTKDPALSKEDFATRIQPHLPLFRDALLNLKDQALLNTFISIILESQKAHDILLEILNKDEKGNYHLDLFIRDISKDKLFLIIDMAIRHQKNNTFIELLRGKKNNDSTTVIDLILRFKHVNTARIILQHLLTSEKSQHPYTDEQIISVLLTMTRDALGELRQIDNKILLQQCVTWFQQNDTRTKEFFQSPNYAASIFMHLGWKVFGSHFMKWLFNYPQYSAPTIVLFFNLSFQNTTLFDYILANCPSDMRMSLLKEFNILISGNNGRYRNTVYEIFKNTDFRMSLIDILTLYKGNILTIASDKLTPTQSTEVKKGKKIYVLYNRVTTKFTIHALNIRTGTPMTADVPSSFCEAPLLQELLIDFQHPLTKEFLNLVNAMAPEYLADPSKTDLSQNFFPSITKLSPAMIKSWINIPVDNIPPKNIKRISQICMAGVACNMVEAFSIILHKNIFQELAYDERLRTIDAILQHLELNIRDSKPASLDTNKNHAPTDERSIEGCLKCYRQALTILDTMEKHPLILYKKATISYLIGRYNDEMNAYTNDSYGLQNTLNAYSSALKQDKLGDLSAEDALDMMLFFNNQLNSEDINSEQQLKFKDLFTQAYAIAESRGAVPEEWCKQLYCAFIRETNNAVTLKTINQKKDEQIKKLSDENQRLRDENEKLKSLLKPNTPHKAPMGHEKADQGGFFSSATKKSKQEKPNDKENEPKP